MAIAFYAEEIELPAISKKAVSNWIKTVAEFLLGIAIK